MVRYHWNNKEIAYLRKNYPSVCGKLLSKKLGVTYSQLIYQARKMNLKKNYDFLLEASKRLADTSIETRFKKGSIPKNKGLKQSDYMSAEAIERSSKSRFKKGAIPHNSLPIGAEVRRFDKRSKRTYLMIKVEGRKSLIYKHVYLYENHHNLKLKRGQNIVFKDGNTENLSIENLECISNVELMERNTFHRYPEELKTQILKNHKLKKIIKKLENGCKN